MAKKEINTAHIFEIAAKLNADMEATAASGVSDEPAGSTQQASEQNSIKKNIRIALSLIKRRLRISAKNLSAKTIPRVSIVIPVFNKAEYTVRCLESVSRQQTRYPFEVII